MTGGDAALRKSLGDFLLNCMYCRRHRVCWWSVNDDDELPGPGHVVRRSATDVATETATASDSSTQTDTTAVTVPPHHRRDCLTTDAADYSQLNHVVRQSDVLKSVPNEHSAA